MLLSMVSSQFTQKKARRRKLYREDKKLAQRVRKLRIERGMTQEELSGLLGHNLSYIAYVETHRSGLSLPAVYRIAKILKVKVCDLFTS